MIRRSASSFLYLVIAASLASAEDAPAPGGAPAAPPGAGGPTTPAPAPSPPRPSTPEQAADAVLAAVAAQDDAALKALAAKDDPDPWLVADELIRRGQHDGALAFAKAAPRAAVKRLPGYVATRRDKADDPARRLQLARANAALVAGDASVALDATGPADGQPVDDVLGVRLAGARGLALDALARPDEAYRSYRSAADAAERIGWLARASTLFDRAAVSASRRSGFVDEREALVRALAVQEALGERAVAARTLGNLGVVLHELGDYASSLATHERALAALEAAGDRAGTASTLANIGNVQSSLGDHASALAAYERALVAMEALGDRAGVATTTANVGLVHTLLGDHAKALAFYERALAAHERLGDRARAAWTLSLIGTVHWSLGHYAKALSTLERAIAMQEALGDRAGMARTLGGIAVVHGSLGAYSKALSLHERVLATMEAIGDRASAASTLVGIGSMHRKLGDDGRALATYERALAAHEETGDRAGTATTLGNIANVHHARGEYAEALSAHGRALAAKEALGDRVGVARTLDNIGLVYLELSDHAQALSFHERALALQEASGDRVGQVRTLAHMGLAHFVLGGHTEALSCARRAIEAQALSVCGLSAEEGSSAREPLSFVFDVGARAALAAKDPRELSHFLESGRAGALLEGLAARAALWGDAVPEALRAEETKARAAEARAAAALRKALDGSDRAARKALRAELEAAQERVAAVVARIQREAKAGAAILYPQAASLEEIRETLGAGDVLVLYALLEGEAAALVVQKDAARIVTLGPRAPIDAAAEAAAEALADDARDAAAPLAALADLVVKPLALPATATRVLVSPTGALSYVPFAVLVPDKAVVYAPSGTTYRLLREEEALRGEGVLALGDPDYATRIDERALAVHRGATARLPQLPGTRKEVEAIGDVTLLAAQATEAGLREALGQRPRWKAVHLACHGLVNTERPALSSLAITPSGEDDGFLSCLDVFRMKVPADLVVLSACETGKGKVVKGEGIVGLTRAFMFAGSPRVLCSLWKVDDDATAALMTKFYELWRPRAQPSDPDRAPRVEGPQGISAAQALREAQAFVRSHEKWKHPYYWAAWVLWGLP